MARHDMIHPDTSWGPAEYGKNMDELIRPGLRQAFPLPAGGDERFRLVLDALSRRGQEHPAGDQGPARSVRRY